MIAGAVFTGGRSRRFGRDKCIETLNGRSLVEIAYLKLTEVVSEIYLVGKNYGLGKFIPDQEPYRGPLFALYGLLKNLKGHEGTIILPCDMPLVPVELLKYITGLSHNYDIVVPEYQGIWQPLVAYYSVRITPTVEELINDGHLSIKRLLQKDLKIRILNEELREFGDPSEYFININRPEDLKRLLSK